MSELLYLKVFSYISILSWSLSYFFMGIKRKIAVKCFHLIPVFIIAIEIIVLWVYLDRPPLRTLGETRLWYAFLLPLFGFLIYLRLNKNWILLYTSLMSILFIVLNLVSPDNFDKTLAPALQSPWFIPHVIVYMISYALLGATSIYSFKRLYEIKVLRSDRSTMKISEVNNFVYSGFSFLTLGLIFGALWAKEAWGDYWTWDPKETWALITWFFYLNYIHLNKKKSTILSLYFLAFGFIVLLLCWFGVNYMPSATSSVHTYTS